MKVFVTGGTGFLGGYVIESLLGEHVDVGVLVRPTRHELSEQLLTTDVPIFEGDILERETLDKVVSSFKPDILIHLAAVTGVAACEQNPRIAFETNVWGTHNVVQSAIQHGANMVFASSREIHGETAGDFSTEDSPKFPKNVYGLTKLLSETILEKQSWKGWCAIFRITNLYGPRGDKYAIQKIIQSALRNQPITVFGGHQILNLVNVRDVARAVVLACMGMKSGLRQFLLAGKDNVSVRDVVEQIVTVSKSKSEIFTAPMRTGDTEKFIPNTERIERELEWKAEIPLEEGLKEDITWYRTRSAQS